MKPAALPHGSVSEQAAILRKIERPDLITLQKPARSAFRGRVSVSIALSSKGSDTQNRAAGILRQAIC